MEAVSELNNRILKTTMLIRMDYPELSKYLLEMPETIPVIDNPEMNKKVLNEYLNSLKEILDKYAPNHGIDIAKI
ncbi:hypothetical protein DOS84_17300 [Flavobacterium aquariorum]|uniref:Uncharacterized protein n=1 Tax=Flavobacterium aquariorum TaxID=2217670 RepID=A0A2W7UA00_9FLAO|nr:hypothetical protein [Flavobacterium aquariorum]PZX92057.1 hypothetical protein DOS84_17300 [Flavobacterium aquariorum]